MDTYLPSLQIFWWKYSKYALGQQVDETNIKIFKVWNFWMNNSAFTDYKNAIKY